MTSSEFDASSVSSSLSASMASVEAAFAPLLSKPWDETLSSLSPLERAKMDVLLAYTINDLIWVYLKMKGHDPANHEVTPELERIRKYYAKIKAVEQPETRTQTIDVPAARRIIKHSLPSRRSHIGGTGAGAGAGPSSSAAISARQQAERAVAEQDSGKDEGVLDRTGLAGRFRFVATEGEKMVPPTASAPGRGEDDVDMGIEGEDEDADGDGDEEDGREDEDEDEEGEDDDDDDNDNDDDGMEVEEQPSEADAVDLLNEVDRDIARGRTRAPVPAVASASASARSKRRRAEDL